MQPQVPRSRLKRHLNLITIFNKGCLSGLHLTAVLNEMYCSQNRCWSLYVHLCVRVCVCVCVWLICSDCVRHDFKISLKSNCTSCCCLLGLQGKGHRHGVSSGSLSPFSQFSPSFSPSGCVAALRCPWL